MTGVARGRAAVPGVDAAEVLRHMEPKEVQKIIAMATMTDITASRWNGDGPVRPGAGLEDLTGRGSDDYIRNMLVQALGSERPAT